MVSTQRSRLRSFLQLRERANMPAPQGRPLCRIEADRDFKAPSGAISSSTHMIRPEHRMTKMALLTELLAPAHRPKMPGLSGAKAFFLANNPLPWQYPGISDP